MDPFVRRLVQRLHDPARPLSRNRHFATFETPEGRAALRVSRHLRSLHRDLQSCVEEGGRARYAVEKDAEGKLRVELTFVRLKGRRTAMLTQDEWELLAALPGVREALALSSR